MSDSPFRFSTRPSTPLAFGCQGDLGTQASLLDHDVIVPFNRVSDLCAIAIPLGPPSDDTDDPADNPGHPVCRAHSRSDYCRESWQLHLSELHGGGRAHWHRCAFGVHCGLVPVACDGRCVAAARVCCKGSICTAGFKKRFELLELLVDGFASTHAETLRSLSIGRASVPPSEPSPPTSQGQDGVRTPNGWIPKTVAYLESRLDDPTLRVEQIATAFGLNAKYLSNLFRRETGIRISELIIRRRLALAKNLLRSTHWQIKRVAGSCGFANPNWFSYVFRQQTGITPGEFRSQPCPAPESSKELPPLDPCLPSAPADDVLPHPTNDLAL